MNLTAIAQAFFTGPAGDLSAVAYGGGHINDTYLLSAHGEKYLLQRINAQVFKEPLRLMENIDRVTRFLSARTRDPRGVLRPMKTRDGDLLYIDADGHWRIFHFIDRSFSYESVPSADVLEKAGRLFGRFLSDLSDFPAAQLYASIPGFHDTAARLEALHAAHARDSHGRAHLVGREFDFCRRRARQAGVIQSLLDSGRLPLRVTHNDTKLNNALFDRETGQPLCVIDLDTVMAGSVLYDFGDAIRSGACRTAEDDPDCARAGVRRDYFEAFTRGFLAEQTGLTALERALLPFGARMMCLECGIRFLTDYLSGDRYFKIHRPGHNLDRCRTQLAMVADLESQQAHWAAIVKKYAATAAADADAR